jgi:glycosyltransferase involved in cell wall biosynthesis
MNADVYVVVPVYNHAESLKTVLEELKQHFKNIVCINDGSRDNTHEVVEAAGVILVEHAVNFGQGAALQTGIDYALQDKKAQYFITFDSDGQHRLKDALTMLNYLRDHPDIDITLGSRFLGEAKNIGTAKKLMLKAAARFLSKTSGVTLTDAHNGLRVFNRRVAEGLNITMPDMAHASEIVERIAEKKFAYKELPVTITYDDYSKAKSHNPMLNSVNIAFDTLLNKVSKK